MFPYPNGAPAAKKAKTANKIDGKINGLTLEQHRRAFGDQVKSKISCEKYTIAARTHVTLKCSFELFEALFAPACDQATPANYSILSEVIVCRATKNIADIFGATKIKGGNRYSFTANCMDIIHYPRKGELDVWWTMDGY